MPKIPSTCTVMLYLCTTIGSGETACNCSSPKTLLLADAISKTIRVHQEYEGRIEKSPDGFIFVMQHFIRVALFANKNYFRGIKYHLKEPFKIQMGQFHLIVSI